MHVDIYNALNGNYDKTCLCGGFDERLGVPQREVMATASLCSKRVSLPTIPSTPSHMTPKVRFITHRHNHTRIRIRERVLFLFLSFSVTFLFLYLSLLLLLNSLFNFPRKSVSISIKFIKI